MAANVYMKKRCLKMYAAGSHFEPWSLRGTDLSGRVCRALVAPFWSVQRLTPAGEELTAIPPPPRGRDSGPARVYKRPSAVLFFPLPQLFRLR